MSPEQDTVQKLDSAINDTLRTMTKLKVEYERLKTIKEDLQMERKKLSREIRVGTL